MKRVIGVAAAVACGSVIVAAAYGGSSLQAIAHQEARYFGDPHAAVTRIERVRIFGARPGHERWAMIRVKGRRPFRVGCPRPGPGPPGPCGAHYLEVGVDLTDPQNRMDWGLTASEVSAIARAWRASRWFRIFPDTPALYLRCAIPRGGAQLRAHRSLPGTCSTVAEPSDHVRRVEFVETFRIAPGGKLDKADWIVTLGRAGRVRSIRVEGQPPQLWK
jgi:hypothetical protein